MFLSSNSLGWLVTFRLLFIFYISSDLFPFFFFSFSFFFWRFVVALLFISTVSESGRESAGWKMFEYEENDRIGSETCQPYRRQTLTDKWRPLRLASLLKHSSIATFDFLFEVFFSKRRRMWIHENIALDGDSWWWQQQRLLIFCFALFRVLYPFHLSPAVFAFQPSRLLRSFESFE